MAGITAEGPEPPSTIDGATGSPPAANALNAEAGSDDGGLDIDKPKGLSMEEAPGRAAEASGAPGELENGLSSDEVKLDEPAEAKGFANPAVCDSPDCILDVSRAGDWLGLSNESADGAIEGEENGLCIESPAAG